MCIVYKLNKFLIPIKFKILKNSKNLKIRTILKLSKFRKKKGYLKGGQNFKKLINSRRRSQTNNNLDTKIVRIADMI